MKRGDLLRHLRAHGCDLLREGGHAGPHRAVHESGVRDDISERDDYVQQTNAPDSAPLHPGYSGEIEVEAREVAV